MLLMKIVEYSSDRAKDIAELFHAAVHSIDASIYSDAQKNAWAETPINYHQWQHRLEQTKPYLLLINGQLAGFMEFELDGHIDCAYVSPQFQRQGVATALLKHVMYLAHQSGLSQLYVEASTVAKPFFEQHGFFLVTENTVTRNTTQLINYTMRKHLSP